MYDLGLLGRAIGALALVAGALMVPPVIPPNPLFGARLPQAFRSRADWNRINRYAGVTFVLAGVTDLVLGQWARSWDASSSFLRGVASLLPVVPILVAARLTRRFAERT